MPRLQSWFEKYNDARSAASKRKQHDHKVAKVLKKHNGEFVGYYVGKGKHIQNLRSRFKIELMK